MCMNRQFPFHFHCRSVCVAGAGRRKTVLGIGISHNRWSITKHTQIYDMCTCSHTLPRGKCEDIKTVRGTRSDLHAACLHIRLAQHHSQPCTTTCCTSPWAPQPERPPPPRTAAAPGSVQTQRSCPALATSSVPHPPPPVARRGCNANEHSRFDRRTNIPCIGQFVNKRRMACGVFAIKQALCFKHDGRRCANGGILVARCLHMINSKNCV